MLSRALLGRVNASEGPGEAGTGLVALAETTGVTKEEAATGGRAVELLVVVVVETVGGGGMVAVGGVVLVVDICRTEKAVDGRLAVLGRLPWGDTKGRCRNRADGVRCRALSCSMTYEALPVLLG